MSTTDNSNTDRSDTDDSESNELYARENKTIFDAMEGMICVVDRDLKIVRVNKGYSDFVGIAVSDLIGCHCYDAFWKYSEKCSDCPCQVTFQTGKAVVNKRIVKKSQDDVRHFEVKTFPVNDNFGRVLHVVEFVKDVTEEKRMIEQLIRSEKLASIGIMTAGIAHEMNNPLSGISGTAVNLLEKPDKYGLNDKGITRVNAILESAARATFIMKDLLRLSKNNDSVHVLVDINKLVMKTVNAVHLEGSSEIQKQFHIDDTLPLVHCDPSKIDQVVFNLVTNAIQSIVEKKRIVSSIGRKHRGVLQVSTQNMKSHILINVTDNGTGISPEIRTRIFDPFFSTKPAGQGTGLGLSVCHRIIEEHQGKIFFESIDDLTIFSVELPLSNGPQVRENK